MFHVKHSPLVFAKKSACIFASAFLNCRDSLAGVAYSCISLVSLSNHRRVDATKLSTSKNLYPCLYYIADAQLEAFYEKFMSKLPESMQRLLQAV